MWGTPISALLNSPTETHEPGLSTAYGNSGAISSRIPHELARTMTHENCSFQRSIHPEHTSKRKDSLSVDHAIAPPLLEHYLLYDSNRRWLEVMVILSIR